ncbi:MULTISPECIES: metalloregulator ArsR/SmtB family transcription factor [Clostridium]|uniref:Metalloregulator ArsR/SmtB family transcription factor n=1 Tax=Clostridium aquiflavi TaxID=3073603 RepID=A0ABU1EI29_9CLOT|nr:MULTISPECIES: metalloregulator ArsR/SmtB family transcription factor [unclassified Clostridium]MDR5588020.1 metalloregulator ArsR/SmtB family transcription factor [Clostridium sp. 5N-1]
MKIDMNKYESVFKSLSDITRLNIIKKLSEKDSMCVCSLVEHFDIPQSKLSYHLKMLLDSNLITMERCGKWNHYSINKEELEKYLSKEVMNDIVK